MDKKNKFLINYLFSYFLIFLVVTLIFFVILCCLRLFLIAILFSVFVIVMLIVCLSASGTITVLSDGFIYKKFFKSKYVAINDLKECRIFYSEKYKFLIKLKNKDDTFINIEPFLNIEKMRSILQILPRDIIQIENDCIISKISEKHYKLLIEFCSEKQVKKRFSYRRKRKKLEET